MPGEPVCLVCQKVMEKGFIADRDRGESFVPRWCPGTPDGGFWAGDATSKQVDRGVKVTAYRCPECHALRLYAKG